MNELTLDLYIISRCTHTYYAHELKKIHVTMGQFPFIMAIAANDGISQEKLSSNMKISKSTTAMIVQQLLGKGLITREVNERDRRNFRLHATEKALILVPEIKKIIAECHRIITRDLSEMERRIFTVMTRKARRRAETDLGRKGASGKMKI